MAKMTDGEMKQIEIFVRGKLGSGAGTSALLELLTRLNGLLNPAVFKQPDAELAQDILDKEASDREAAEKFAAAAEESRKRMADLIASGEGTEVLAPPVVVDEPHPVLEPQAVPTIEPHVSVLVDPSTIPVA